MLALAAASCTRRSRDRRSTLTIAYPLSQWDDVFTDSDSQFLVFLPLVTRSASGGLEGRLAESWEHSSDYRSWTVRLRQGIRWHDGVPVTAHDIKFTLDLATHPAVWSAAPGSFAVTVHDDQTYQIVYGSDTTVRMGSPLDDYAIFYPRHRLAGLDPATMGRWAFWAAPVGNGPYRYVRRQEHTMMEFEANPDHYRGKPRIERVVLKFLDRAGVPELLSGSVDAIASAERSTELLQDTRFDAHHLIELDHDRVLAWNLERTGLDNTAVRRALTLAIDRRELHRLLGLPAQTPIFDSPVTMRQWRRGELADPLPYDADEATRLLDEAGWRVTDRHGVRAREGAPLQFTILAPVERAKEATYIQAQLRRIAVDAEVQTMEWLAVRERVWAGNFDAALIVANARLDSRIGMLPFFGEESIIGYANPEVQVLLRKLAGTIDPDEVDQIYRQLALHLTTDLPVTYLYPNVETSVASRRVRGLSTPFRADLLRYTDELWLEEDW